jgi:rubrerythrin
MANHVEIGLNRTGIATSPRLAQEMVEGTREFPPMTNGDERTIGLRRGEYVRESEGLGSVPPPTSLKGMAKTALQGVLGQRPTLMLDKLSERLAFERTGVRLYEALISKLEAAGSFEGGPTREELVEMMQEEYSHYNLLTEVVTKMGADPTVMTPSADLHATITRGVMEAIVDARTNLAQALEALLVAELADGDAWDSLIELVGEAGGEIELQLFEQAAMEEAKHLERVRTWIAASQNRASGDLSDGA